MNACAFSPMNSCMVHFVRAAQGVDTRAREKTLAGCCSLAQERNRIRGQTAGVQNNGGELILPEWQRREVKVEQMLFHRDLLRNHPALQDDGGHGAWLQISINSRELHRDVVRDTYLTATGSAERERQARFAKATAMSGKHESPSQGDRDASRGRTCTPTTDWWIRVETCGLATATRPRTNIAGCSSAPLHHAATHGNVARTTARRRLGIAESHPRQWREQRFSKSSLSTVQLKTGHRDSDLHPPPSLRLLS